MIKIKISDIRAFSSNYTRIVFLATLLFLLVVSTPLATAFNSPSASVHVLSGGYYSCDGANHTAPVAIHIPPPPYRTVIEGRERSFTNCVEIQIRSCRYEAGLSIVFMAPPSPRLAGGGNNKAIVWITIENSTLLSSDPASGSIGAAAYLLTSSSSSRPLDQNSSAVVSGSLIGTNIEPSFVLDFFMVNSTVKALTTSTLGSAYAMRFANVSVVESRIAVVGCTIEASAHNSAAYVWTYENVNISDSSILTTGCNIASSGGTSCSVWYYRNNNVILNSTLQTVGCNISSSSAASHSLVWYYSSNNNILNSTLQTAGCNITSTSSNFAHVWYYNLNNAIGNSTLQTVDCNITSSGRGSSNSFVWYYRSNNDILNSTLQTVRCNIASTSSSSSVWYDLNNNIFNSTLQTVGCNITSTSSSANSYVWYYFNSTIANSTLQTVGCNITSTSRDGSAFSYVWYYSSNNNILNSTLQTVGCNITSSSAASHSLVWYYYLPTGSLLGNTSVTFVNSSARIMSSAATADDLVYFHSPSASTVASGSTFYWSNSRYILGNSGTPQSLLAAYLCGGVASCCGLQISVDSLCSLYSAPYASYAAICPHYYRYVDYISISLYLEAFVVHISSSQLTSSRTGGRGLCGVYTSTPTLTALNISRSESSSTASSVSYSLRSSESTSATSTVANAAPSSPASFSLTVSLSLPTSAPSGTAIPSTSDSQSASPVHVSASLSSSSSVSATLWCTSRARSSSSTGPFPFHTRTVHLIAPIPAPSRLEELSGSLLVAVGPVVTVAAVAGVSGGQLGAMNAMARLASCKDNNDEDDVPVLVHPLRFSLFSAHSKAAAEDSLLGQYAAAAISNGVLIPLVVWVVVYWAVPYAAASVVSKGVGIVEEVRSRLGWPCVMVLPFATLAEGTAVSVVMSWRSGVNYLVMCGAAGFLSVALVFAWWVRALVVLIPRCDLRLAARSDARTQSTKAVGAHSSVPLGDRLRSLAMRWVAASHEWEATVTTPSDGLSKGLSAHGSSVHSPEVFDVSSPANTNTAGSENNTETSNGPLGDTFVEMGELPASRRALSASIADSENKQRLRRVALVDERYCGLLGDKRWYYAEVTSFVCSIVVGAAEGMPSGGGYCVPRAAVAMVAVIGQCVCGCTTLARHDFVLQIVLSACVIPMSVLAVCLSSGLSGGTGEGMMLNTMSTLNIIANIVGIVQMVCQAVVGAVLLCVECRMCLVACSPARPAATGLVSIAGDLSACELARPLLPETASSDCSTVMPEEEENEEDEASSSPDVSQSCSSTQSGMPFQSPRAAAASRQSEK